MSWDVAKGIMGVNLYLSKTDFPNEFCTIYKEPVTMAGILPMDL